MALPGFGLRENILHVVILKGPHNLFQKPLASMFMCAVGSLPVMNTEPEAMRVIKNPNGRTAIVLLDLTGRAEVIEMTPNQLVISTKDPEALEAAGWAPVDYPVEKAASRYLAHKAGVSEDVRIALERILAQHPDEQVTTTTECHMSIEQNLTIIAESMQALVAAVQETNEILKSRATATTTVEVAAPATTRRRKAEAAAPAQAPEPAPAPEPEPAPAPEVPQEQAAGHPVEPEAGEEFGADPFGQEDVTNYSEADVTALGAKVSRLSAESRVAAMKILKETTPAGRVAGCSQEVLNALYAKLKTLDV